METAVIGEDHLRPVQHVQDNAVAFLNSLRYQSVRKALALLIEPLIRPCVRATEKGYAIGIRPGMIFQDLQWGYSHLLLHSNRICRRKAISGEIAPDIGVANLVVRTKAVGESLQQDFKRN
jgi:hypothetical protein